MIYSQLPPISFSFLSIFYLFYSCFSITFVLKKLRKVILTISTLNFFIFNYFVSIYFFLLSSITLVIKKYKKVLTTSTHNFFVFNYFQCIYVFILLFTITFKGTPTQGCHSLFLNFFQVFKISSRFFKVLNFGSIFGLRLNLRLKTMLNSLKTLKRNCKATLKVLFKKKNFWI